MPDVAALSALYLTIDVPIGESVIAVTYNVVRLDTDYYKRLYDRTTPFSVGEALAHLQVSWDLTHDGAPLLPVTAENLTTWQQEFPWLRPIAGVVLECCAEEVRPKALAAATQGAPPALLPSRATP